MQLIQDDVSNLASVQNALNQDQSVKFCFFYQYLDKYANPGEEALARW